MAKKKSTWIVITVVVLALIAVGVWYFGFRDAPEAAAAEGEQQILTIEAKPGSVAVRVEGPSVVEPYRTQTIRSGIEGLVLFAPSEGDAFEKEATLVRFDSAEKEKAVKQARISLSQASLALETAQADLENTVVIAPFSGVVLRSELAPGDLISKGAILLTYADLSRVRLQAEVDEFDIGKVEKGQSVTIGSDALGDDVLKSKV